ncbi:MAG: methylenetetrahydrofolate dehydrogenase / methenyltetrahydrofolate cyclohydrolase, partial [Gaiellales bacterium]|nr:methylenetetrahydrofolate dehydrogenase / methenyltetrahydrofolate cyclohydrolase [Gaiellales bacterium]
MTAAIIDGAAVSSRVREEVAAGVADLVARGGPVPGLATVLVGSDPASQVYVRNKNQAT